MTYKDITGAGLTRAGYLEYFDQTLQRNVHHRKHIFKNFVEFTREEVKSHNTRDKIGAAELNIDDDKYIKRFMYALNDLTNNMNNIMRYIYLSDNKNSNSTINSTINYKELSSRFPIKIPSNIVMFHLVGETSLVSFADSLNDDVIVMNITDETFISFLHSMNAIPHKYMHSTNTILDVMKAVGYSKNNIENKYSIYTTIHFHK